MSPRPASVDSVEPSHLVLQQAAAWFARLRDGTASARDRVEWEHWLRAAEAHRTAWQYVEEVSRGLEPLHRIPEPKTAADKLCEANDRLRTRRRMLAGMAAVAAGGLVGWIGWRQDLLPDQLVAWTADHRTAIGEQRDITLADGTRIMLNTSSAVNLAFGESERRIRLIAGEVFVDTAADPVRPFLVDTPQGRLRALGTRFNVRLERDDTLLAVYQGAVEIRTSGNSALGTVSQGEQARFGAHRIGPLEPADIAHEAWVRGALIAHNLPLSSVVRELRRYRPGYLGLADEVAGLEVYGSFPIHDTDRVLEMLAGALPIRIEQTLPWWTSIEAR